MSDHPKDKQALDHEWQHLDEPAPSQAEQEAAQQLASLLAGAPFEASSEGLPDAEDALAMAHFLEHIAAPPILSAARKDAIEAAMLGLWDDAKVAEVAPAQRAARPQAAAIPAPSRSVAPRPPTHGWLAGLIGWLPSGPKLALAGAFVAVIAMVSILDVDNMAPPTRSAQAPLQQEKAIGQPSQKMVVAHLSGSPWGVGHNPFASTKSPGQRLGYVLEHNSQRALDSAFSSQSQQHLYRLR